MDVLTTALDFRVYFDETRYKRNETQITMKSHHAATLALVAWFLMMPPPRPVGDHFKTNFYAPISKWTKIRRFDLQSQCESAREAYQQKPTGNLVIMLGAAEAQATTKASLCVATGDPRLKSP
jgi:hypothetical protein